MCRPHNSRHAPAHRAARPAVRTAVRGALRSSSEPPVIDVQFPPDSCRAEAGPGSLRIDRRYVTRSVLPADAISGTRFASKRPIWRAGGRPGVWEPTEFTEEI